MANAIYIFVMCAAFYVLVRNGWVFRTRQRILHESRWDQAKRSHVEYDSLPSYDAMMIEFWNWNAASFIGRRGK